MAQAGSNDEKNLEVENLVGRSSFTATKPFLVRLQVLNKNSGFYENVTWLFFPGVETKLGVYLSVFYNELS